MQNAVYIMASTSGVMYVGATSDLKKRIYEHRTDAVEGFTKKYKCHKLVYYEITDEIMSAIEREKQLKKWSRFKKVRLIETMNEKWNDLFDAL